MTTMTTECAKCRHKFLRYASNCPECGWIRPRRKKFNKAMAVSLVASALAIGLTFVIGDRIRQQDEVPVRQSRPSGILR